MQTCQISEMARFALTHSLMEYKRMGPFPADHFHVRGALRL